MTEKKDVCVICGLESDPEAFWKFPLPDLSFYFFCSDCLKKEFREYQGFMEFLYLRLEHREE